MNADLRTYVVAQLPSWIVVALGVILVSRWASVPPELAAALLAVWIVKDLLLYPTMRRFYRPEPAEERIVGLQGVAVTGIAPRGFVRVRGELWQAESEHPIAAGAPVRVLAVDGLQLRVASP
jgi:membrane-bound ClpP family serine protease